MKMHLLALLLLIGSVVITDAWLFMRWRGKTKNRGVLALFWLPSLLFIGFFLLVRMAADNVPSYQLSARLLWVFWAFAVLYVPKLVYTLFDCISFVAHRWLHVAPKLISRIGAVLALVIASGLVYGAFWERKHLTIERVEVSLEQLPEAFDGFRIVHISDFHLGNWGKRGATIGQMVAMVNAQKPDVILFTGDMVNNFAEELEPYIDTLSQLYAPHGAYAIMGNHDYGDYTDWKNSAAKDSNFARIKEGIALSGFRLLLNEHVPLTIGTDTIDLVGVENWGKPPFKQYGNLAQALEGTVSTRLKILLSHDTSHWQREVVGQPAIGLTLSGHTHAGQLGIRCGRFQYSPSAWMYKEWSGLYREHNQYLYVNRGIGYVGVPMRVGVPPEITVLTLGCQK